MTLKVFADRMSQPSRAVILFCKLNKINFEEVRIDLFKRQHFSQEFAEINPLRQVPAIVDGRFKLYESHAILIYLSCAFPGIADHWYPADVSKRAKIHSVLDWHHLNLRYGAMRYVVNTTLGPALGRPLDSQAAARAEKVLDSSLATIESVWLEGSGKFLLGSKSPSIADLSLVCEIMQLEVLDEKDRARILNPYKKVRAWIEATKVATHPHFDDVHGVLFRAKAKFQKQRERDLTAASSNARLHSKM
ncbi:glutathione S-transferase T1 isoform X1 [Beta vulgaris subsp. vulgaris]|uniref:glutathione S-transferase T1 isoform X1 n=1 Tax=Beta vulgaris subsp. vulgaris TaxID=3555 RepID=UPI002036AF54|nr:glutathione S-transferase T1 isoform X1 [Beta vulgaris subsp. vulgaris]